MSSRWSRRFLDTTRGKVISLLHRGDRTVEELAEPLQLTDNAVRAHLATLERDGLVEQTGVRRGAGKPAYLYGLTQEAERLFPKAYAPVLGRLLDALSERFGAEEAVRAMRSAGRGLAADHRAPSGGRPERLEAAVAVLNDLGGVAELEDGSLIRGYSCPLSEVVEGHPEVCKLVESLLAEIVGAPIRERCERGDRPRCRFEISRN